MKSHPSGVFTERVGDFTVDSSENPPAYEDKHECNLDCLNTEQMMRWGNMELIQFSE